MYLAGYMFAPSIDTRHVFAGRTIMAEAVYVDRCYAKEVSDVLDTLGTGVFHNTFSERGRGRIRKLIDLRRSFVRRKMKRSLIVSIET